MSVHSCPVECRPSIVILRIDNGGVLQQDLHHFPLARSQLPSVVPYIRCYLLCQQGAPFFSRSFTIPSYPFSTANRSAVAPLSFVLALISAPNCKSNSTVNSIPLLAAQWSAVRPPSSAKLVSAPRFSSSFNTSTYPFRAAQCSAVRPLLSSILILAPWFSSTSTSPHAHIQLPSAVPPIHCYLLH